MIAHEDVKYSFINKACPLFKTQCIGCLCVMFRCDPLSHCIMVKFLEQQINTDHVAK